MNKNIALSVEKARELYKTAGADFKTLLEENFSLVELKGSLIDSLTTWESVVQYYTQNLGGYISLPNCPGISIKESKALWACRKLQIISHVFNEGWEPDWTNNSEYKWYNWFEKDVHSGWRFHVSFCFGSGCLIGFGLYFKSEAIAKHVAKHFLDIYVDYLPN